MPASLALVALLSLHLPSLSLPSVHLPFGHGRQPNAPQRFGDWTLSVRTDSFSTGHVCKLTRPHAEYQRQAVVFHLSPSTDTSAAVYRIVGGVPMTVQADQSELARLGFNLHDDNLDNPSGGLVRIPISRLVAAGDVRIETAAFSRSIKFNLGGLKPALEAAKAAGCRVEDFQ